MHTKRWYVRYRVIGGGRGHLWMVYPRPFVSGQPEPRVVSASPDLDRIMNWCHKFEPQGSTGYIARQP